MLKVSSIYSILMGSAMLVTWTVLFLKGSVEGLDKPFGLTLLLIAEGLTALMLITGGWATLGGSPWGMTVQLIGLGMLLYCTIFSTGEFGQAGNVPAAVFFAVVAILTAVLTGYWILQSAAQLRP